MDLVQTVRKEGSRGGRGDFKWEDVTSSSHRENYLGHSLMAPVGRWQKGRDLSWYAKPDSENADDQDAAIRAANERKEEIRRIKEAEQDALAKALGFEVTPRSNANMQPLGPGRGEVEKMVQSAANDGEADEGGKGIGFGAYGGGASAAPADSDDRLEGSDMPPPRARRADDRPGQDHRTKKDERNRRRSRSRDRERRHHDHHHRQHRHRHRSLSRDRHRDRKRRDSESRSRSRSGRRERRDRDRDREDYGRRRERSYSPRRLHHDGETNRREDSYRQR